MTEFVTQPLNSTEALVLLGTSCAILVTLIAGAGVVLLAVLNGYKREDGAP